MASHQYASENGCGDSKVLKMPCYMSGRCSDLGTGGMQRLMMARCSDGVAMGLRLMRVSMSLRLALVVVGIVEVEVSDNTGLIFVIVVVLVALDSSSRSSLIVEERRNTEKRCMEIGCKPLQRLALKLVVAQ